MIDTGEYTGHTEGKWEIWGDHIIGPLQRKTKDDYGSHRIIANFPKQGKPDGWWGDLLPEMEANMKLMADAPLLLAEVKRLRETIADIARSMDAADPVVLQDFIKDLYEVIE